MSLCIRVGITFFLYFIILCSLVAQEKYPQNYFIPPLDPPLYLSGTFGELRSDHFHSGIDLRTGEAEGLKVYAVADGYVSRIKVSSGGYGKAIYITHNNGFVSVYAHLQQYLGNIKDYLRDEQYRRESFEVDLYPLKGALVVKQGEVIALSGNSGGSGGPHLHFEIRDESSQMPINPLLFGYFVEDISPPVINMLKVYPYDQSSKIQNNSRPAQFNVVGSNGKYFIDSNDTITVTGKVYFGINTIDLFNNGNNKNGVYSIGLLIDSILIFQQEMEAFSFSETRYINSLIDFPERILNNRWIQKSYIQPNNHLSIYKRVNNKGIINFNDNDLHSVIYKITDAAGNVSTLKFHVKSKILVPDSYVSDEKVKNGILFSYRSNNIFETENLYLNVPGEALYDTLLFSWKRLPAQKKSVSPVYLLHDPTVPLHAYCELKIRPDSLSDALRGKALITKIDNVKGFISAGGDWLDGFVKTKIREFGQYCVVLDTVAPIITPVNILNEKNISMQNTIRVKIKDDLSGIAAYRGSLNGQWILMDYDAKNDLLTYTFDKRLVIGPNLFELTVTDKKSNISNFRTKLNY